MTVCECSTFTLNNSTCSLTFPMPEWGLPENEISKDVVLFNFWDEDLDTVDKGIDTQTLNIGGTLCICGEWEGLCFPLCFPLCFSGPLTTWLENVETAMNGGYEFEINELGDCLNGVYVIRNFTFNTILKSAECFSWSLNLERVRDIS